MNWIEELLDLYHKNENLAGLLEPKQPILLPLYHTTVSAQLTVTIDENGNFLHAEIVPEEERITIIPATDRSSSRTGKAKAPHPLCDSLKYLAEDYIFYTAGEDCREEHRLYMEQLEKWQQSPYTHPKVEAIYQYLCRGQLMKDLIRKKILTTDSRGIVDPKRKIQKNAQTDAVVRFRVESHRLLKEGDLLDSTGQYVPECWKDRTLMNCYIQYSRSLKGKTDLSYLTGTYDSISYLQPRKIRNEGDGAKLISANDKQNFTYRGRFLNKEEAFAIGYEDSQKVHNALRWIIRKQGTNYDGMYFVIWESNSEKVFDWMRGTDEICRLAERNGWSEEGKESEENYWTEDEDDCAEEVNYVDTGEAGASRFQRAIKGYQSNLSQSSRTVIMAVDAAVPGRLSLLEFKNYQSSRYLDGLQKWYENCEWIQWKRGEKGKYSFKGMVGIRDAAELLYGIEEDGHFVMKKEEKLCKNVAKRLMPCILEGKEVPLDMVRVAVQKASSPVSYKDPFLWKRVLGFACSLVKQQRKHRYKEEWTMALDENHRERDYLYGRLLAVADRIEYRTQDKEDGRVTNAKRYMVAFSRNPFRTWKIIEEKMVPYLNQLKMPERLKYFQILDSIYAKFSVTDFENDHPLSGLYLLGFHHQSYELRAKKEEKKEETEHE